MSLLPVSVLANTDIHSNSTATADTAVKIPQLSQKDTFACQAFLCFAGGMHTPECQSTIRKVTRDLARGRSFPVCSMIANPDGSVGGQNGSQRIWTRSTKRRVYVYVQEPSGDVRQVANIRKR